MKNIQEIQDCFEKRMASFEAELLKKSSNAASLTGLAEEFALFKSLILDTLKSFQKQIEVIAREVDNMETRSRRKILLFHGVEEKKGEDTSKVVMEVAKKKLKIDSFSLEEISRCHRLGRESPGEKSRPILVKFRSVAVQDTVWTSKTKLKGTGVTVSEFLTRSRHAAFMAAREEFGITKCWTREGSVFVLGPDGSRYRISSLADLNKMKAVETEKPTVAKNPTSKLRRAAGGSKKQ